MQYLTGAPYRHYVNRNGSEIGVEVPLILYEQMSCLQPTDCTHAHTLLHHLLLRGCYKRDIG
jgi:hypothetical protein